MSTEANRKLLEGRNFKTGTTVGTYFINYLTTQKKKASENILGKRENSGNQHFLLFPKYFLPYTKQSSIFEPHLSCCLHVLGIWTTSLKFCRSVKS